MRAVEEVDLRTMNIDEVSTDAKLITFREEADGSYRLFEDEIDRTPVVNETLGQVLDIHGKDYKLLPNSKFLEIVKGVTGDVFSGYVNRESKRIDVYYFPDDENGIDPVEHEFVSGDPIRFGLRFSNSYDGSSALRVQFIGQRLVCANGMSTENLLDKASTRHSTQSLQPDKFAELVQEKFADTDFGLLRDIMHDAHKTMIVEPLEWLEGFALISGIPDALKKHVQIRLLKESPDEVSRYALYQMFTKAVTHGYVRTEKGMRGGADEYSESYLQRLHKQINEVLLVPEETVRKKVGQIKQAEEMEELANKLKAEIVAEP